MKRPRPLPLLGAVLVGVWFLFTASLTAWWLIFSLRQIHRLYEIQHESIAELARYQRMLLWEGGVLFISILAGGCALGYLMLRELRQRRTLQEFFSVFTHEIKTPIASVRLQAEVLLEKLTGTPHEPPLHRLVSDTRRLTLQLENALMLSSVADVELFIETVDLAEFVESLRGDWPEMQLELVAGCTLKADRRALHSIFQNLLQNSRTHGRATRLVISPEHHGDRVTVTIRDNGAGFGEDPQGLGTLFRRFTSTSSAGVGLYLVGRLAQRMEGKLAFVSPAHGFELQLTIPSAESAP